MREIKFRAWDKEVEKMWDYEDNGNEVGFCLDTINNTLELIDLSNDERALTLNCEFMQYTGLKDKNGKEIYEGDIVKYYSMIQDKEVLAEVVFKEGCFVISEYYLGNKKRFEVMGNIYENPELLEV